ncbi:MAG: alpha/beta fold hydrolase [Bacteroidota bacterium]|nr:alpha/beta fold hydrolase [Bacteroidota bacterium]
MKNTLALALLGASLAGLTPRYLLAQTPAALPAASLPASDAPGLAGLWQGMLPIPGGSVPVTFTVQLPAANKLIATLDLAARKQTSLPTSVTLRGDTVIFFTPKAGCRYTCLLSADRQELRGTWVQPGLNVPLNLRRATTQPGTSAASTTLPAVATTYHTEPVTITTQAGNVVLAGTLSIPDGAGPFPAAVLLSDMGPHDRDARQGGYRPFADLSASLARQGIAVLRLDDRGVGQSSGDSRLATTADRVRDAQAALSYLRLRPTLDPSRVGLIGHGEGGNVALLAAGQPQPPNFVVGLAAAGIGGLDLLTYQAEPLSPADTARLGTARRQALADIATKAKELRASGSNSAQIDTYVAQQQLKLRSAERKQAEAMLKFRRAMFDIIRQTSSNEQAQAIVKNMLTQRYPDQEAALLRTRAEGLTTAWYRDYLKFDPQTGLDQVQCPVLLLNGTDDAEVNAATNLTALEKGLKANKRVTVRRLPGVNHWFQTPAAEMIRNADGSVDPVLAPVVAATLHEWIAQQSGI